MMTKNVEVLSTTTCLPIPPDRILKAWKGKLQELILLGYDLDGKLVCCSSSGSIPDALYLAEQFKQKLMKQAE